ncbi:AraC family transcriptional regulator [Dehalobacterium formicoaceticum]|uniref:AraC family transcriptional regulator n=1 Tax=Dehalobacterium formicoaceticum TaxID=51515 RepID=A0ABT1Y8J4_9FIRM|nr:CD1247 N-terminal domain-containing protein [Dehalobacterium formicoaceticum]MCR6545966.1 AraC family transcriptional regulator [Dehalobacterium formicoaceticum]
MKDLKQQIAYLQGLAEGLGISEETKEGKVIKQIINVLEEMALSITDLEMQQSEMEDYLEGIDDDLTDLEDDFYDEDDEDDDEDDTDYVEVKCPNCNDIVCFDADILEDDDLIEVTCPHCDEVVYINDGSYDDPCTCCGDHELDEFDFDDDEEKESHTEDI